jgi:glycosyltransferase involved in cell wall biosynthesis
MSKIKILVLPSDKSGVGKFRSLEPHIFLQNQYPDDFYVDIDYEPNLDDITYWQKYDMVCFHRSLSHDFDKSHTLIQVLNSLGIITVMDLDDYWLPTKEHPAHHLVVQNKIHEKIIANLKVAKYVTTTTEIFAQEIKKYNKNVFVLPNAINPNEPQFMSETKPSDKLRFGWLGGSSHLHDIELLRGATDALGHELRSKSEFHLCGFDIRGTMTEINAQTGEQKQRPILPNETVWARYEEIFTKNYEFTTPEYKNYLMKFRQEKWDGDSQFYNRVWTEPVTSYAKNYSKFDVSLAPLVNHVFNRVKSQLKVIEAGFYKKAIIASNIGPYTIDLKHCLNNGDFVDGNAILVDEKRNHSDWTKAMKKLINNPNMAFDMGQRLYETVKDKYDLNIVTKHRAELYKTLK